MSAGAALLLGRGGEGEEEGVGERQGRSTVMKQTLVDNSVQCTVSGCIRSRGGAFGNLQERYTCAHTCTCMHAHALVLVYIHSQNWGHGYFVCACACVCGEMKWKSCVARKPTALN